MNAMEEKTISLERFYYAAAWNGILSYWLLLADDALEAEDRRRNAGSEEFCEGKVRSMIRCNGIAGGKN
jgi:hypothetical protein